jgi:hypothetical protein
MKEYTETYSNLEQKMPTGAEEIPHSHETKTPLYRSGRKETRGPSAA